MSQECTLPSDQCFRVLIEHSRDAIVLLTEEGTVTYASPSTERVTGSRPEALLGTNGFALLPPDDWQVVQQRWSTLLDQPGNAITFACHLSHTDGTWRWMEATLTNLLHEPAVEAVVCYYREITQRKQEQERLRQSEERYRVLVEEAGVGLFVTDIHDQYVEVNEMACRLSGYSREELLTMQIQDLVSQDDQAALPTTLARMRSGTFKHNRWRMKRKDGSLVPVDMVGNLLSTGHLLAIVRDISHQLRAEGARQQRLAYEQAVRAQAQAARARLYDLFMQAPVAMTILRGPQHRVEFANPRAFPHRDRADLFGRPLGEVVPEVVAQGVVAMLDQVYTTGTPYVGTEVPIWIDRRGDGVLEEAYYNLVYQPTRSLQGDIDGIWVTSIEVTDQVLARRRVEELNRQLEGEKHASLQVQQQAETHAAELSAIFEAMTEAVAVCDAKGDITYINAAYRSLMGLDEDVDLALLQLDKRFEWLAIRDMEGRPVSKEHIASLRVLGGERLSGPNAIDLVCQTYKGEDIIANVSGAPIRDARGQILGGVIIFRDVTRQHTLERQLQYSERKLRSLVESNIFGMWVVDGTGRIYEANDRLVQMVGYSREELLSGTVTWQQLIPPASPRCWNRPRRCSARREPFSPSRRNSCAKTAVTCRP